MGNLERLLVGDQKAPGLVTILTNQSFLAKLSPSVDQNVLVSKALVNFVATVCNQAQCPINYINCRAVLLSESSVLIALISGEDRFLSNSMASVFEILRLWLLMNPTISMQNTVSSCGGFSLDSVDNSATTETRSQVINSSNTTSNRALSKIRTALGEARLRRFAGWLSVQYLGDSRNGLAVALVALGSNESTGCKIAQFSSGQRHIIEKTPHKTPIALWDSSSRSGFAGDQFLAVLRTPGPWDDENCPESGDKTGEDCSLESSFMLPIQEPQVTRVSGGNLLKLTGDMEEVNQAIHFQLEERNTKPEHRSQLRQHKPGNHSKPHRKPNIKNSAQCLPQSGFKSLLTPARPTAQDSKSAEGIIKEVLEQKSDKGDPRCRRRVFTPRKSGPDKENTNFWNTGPKLAGRAPFQPT